MACTRLRLCAVVNVLPPLAAADEIALDRQVIRDVTGFDARAGLINKHANER